MDYVLLFAAGLIFGSFGNVIIFGLNTGELFHIRGSRCFFCGRKLKWFENIPVASFLFLKGRCRICRSRISFQYPLVELASGLIFLSVYIRSEPGSYHGKNPVLTIFAIFFFWILLLIAVYDIRHKIIPDSLVYIAIVSGLIFSLFFMPFDMLVGRLLTAAGLFVFFAGLHFISRGRWMGFGDAKLVSAIGLALGWPEGVVGILFSFWSGALAGLIFALAKNLRSLKIQIPFAPFLFLGSWFAFLFGERLILWYFSLL